MQAAVHLPQVPFAGPATELPARARDVVDAAGDLGFVGVSANDHFTFSTQWVDGLMLLASIAERAGPLELMTTVALPALRGPVAFASSITALAAMSEGRVVAGVGPGSSAADHGLAGLDWSRRWQRYDETLQVLRSLLGGDGVPAGLRFYAPADQPTAVLTDVPRESRMASEEIFGPIAAVQRFSTEDEAVARANDTEFGLGAGVWSRDMNVAYRMGRGIKAGRVWTNCYHLYPAHAAFGGYKKSGVGRETHKMMLDHYQQTKNLLVSYDINPLGFF